MKTKIFFFSLLVYLGGYLMGWYAGHHHHDSPREVRITERK